MGKFFSDTITTLLLLVRTVHVFKVYGAHLQMFCSFLIPGHKHQFSSDASQVHVTEQGNSLDRGLILRLEVGKKNKKNMKCGLVHTPVICLMNEYA